jgi:phage tail sheath protein FI
MAGIPTSPAVVFLEKDNSAYPPNINSSIVGIVGYASKGPTDEATLITSQENLIRIFGNPIEALYGQGLEGALEILETTNQVRYVRAVPPDATEASGNMQFGSCPAIIFSGNDYGRTRNLFLTVSLTDSQGVNVISNQEIDIFSSVDNVDAGLSQASAIAKIVGDGTSRTDHVFVAFNTATQASGYLVGAYAGSAAVMTVAAFSEEARPVSAGLPILAKIDSLVGSAGSFASSVTVSGASINLSSLSYLTQSLYQGYGYNLSSDPYTGQTLGVSVEVENGGGLKSLVTVNNEGVAAESYIISLLNDTTFIENVINVGVDNAISDYIKGELWKNTASLGPVNPLTDSIAGIKTLNSSITINGSSDNDTKFVKLVNTTKGLAGGSNGTMAASGVIGSPANKTGLYALDDDLLNISMAVIPGITDQRVQNALITLAETSQNFIAAVSPPIGLDSAQEAIDWMNGKDGVRTSPINSSWAAVFWPWVQVFDVFSAKDMWYDPAVFAVRQMAFTDNVAETWFAPAGFRRGRLTKPTAVETALNQGDRDSLYVTNINPIVNFAPEGITIFGQKTAQRAATSLDRINVRRLMIFLRKVLLQTGRIDLFEPNDAFTWDSIKDKAEALLSDIQARRGITDFRVICDETVNTPVRVDRNELWCKILLKPTKTAEWIIFEVNLTNQSAKFSG